MNPLIKNYTAAGAIGAYRIAKFGANDGEVLQAGTATDALAGVTGILPAAAGERTDLQKSGLALIEFGGTVARGAPLTADAQGRAIAAVPAAGANMRIIGYAEVSAVSGDIAQLWVSPGTVQG